MGPIGHGAIGLLAKPAAPKAPLWVLLAATEVIDLLWFVFAALGIEDPGVTQIDLAQGITVLEPGHIPWSHGLFMALVWSLLAAAIAYGSYRERRTASVIGLLVFSHWVLDFVVHTPDLPLLFDSSQTVGLGLWGSGTGLVISFLLEVGLFCGGIAVYLIFCRHSNIRISARGSAS